MSLIPLFVRLRRTYPYGVVLFFFHSIHRAFARRGTLLQRRSAVSIPPLFKGGTRKFTVLRHCPVNGNGRSQRTLCSQWSAGLTIVVTFRICYRLVF